MCRLYSIMFHFISRMFTPTKLIRISSSRGKAVAYIRDEHKYINTRNIVIFVFTYIKGEDFVISDERTLFISQVGS